ncbi:hypothetical protein N658DRAFT_242928 [Parathielavia hyrcaniae]|uniref:Uncharacterized protein n=1 Tax=Parathielavia hyrcaniae TaxID=113614 RepID=A0AAN6Q5V5_9PEZI|nr:hypothetical protein N658DRAFT_242928 [Parathielavia hyrcaniae]
MLPHLLPIAQIPGFPSSKAGTFGTRPLSGPHDRHRTPIAVPGLCRKAGARVGSVSGLALLPQSFTDPPFGKHTLASCILHPAPRTTTRRKHPVTSPRRPASSSVSHTRSATAPHLGPPPQHSRLFRAAGCYFAQQPGLAATPH